MSPQRVFLVVSVLLLIWLSSVLASAWGADKQTLSQEEQKLSRSLASIAPTEKFSLKKIGIKQTQGEQMLVSEKNAQSKLRGPASIKTVERGNVSSSVERGNVSSSVECGNVSSSVECATRSLGEGGRASRSFEQSYKIHTISNPSFTPPEHQTGVGITFTP